MQTSTPHLVRRGSGGTFYIRRRIPRHLLPAFPNGKREIIVSLRTADRRIAERRLHAEQLKIEATFASCQKQLEERIRAHEIQLHQTLSAPTPEFVTNALIDMGLRTDDYWRFLGLTDEQFDEYATLIATQRVELGRLAARGRIEPLVPALEALLGEFGHELPKEHSESRELAFAVLKGLMRTCDVLLRRNAGEIVETADIVAGHPTAPQKIATWDEVFDTWAHYVTERPKSTVIAYLTAWRQLIKFARGRNVENPAAVTPEMMTDFVEHARAQGLDASTINARLTNIRSIFKIGVGKHILPSNPAQNTLGVKIGKRTKRGKSRLPFDQRELNLIFSSEVFTAGARSSGMSGEACYWIPLIMYFSGARTEEVAGLMVDDIVTGTNPSTHYFYITDLPSREDLAIFDDGTGGKESVRGLKNVQSRRKVPVARQLVELGLFDYVAWLKSRGEKRLFPTLIPDTHDKLSGAFGKWFGRYKRSLGIESDRKVAYSFRHGFKSYLDQALVPSKVLRRLMGHTLGDGAVTDSYGDEDLPFEILQQQFDTVDFPPIPALPWRPPAP